MRDVAAAAGVSLSTVSRVINGIEVQGELERRVQDAVRRLDYRPEAARDDRRAAGSIGLVCDDVADPFFAALQRGVHDVAHERGVLAFAASTDTAPGREREVVGGLSGRGVEGLIVAPAASDERHLRREADAGLALVFVDRPARWIEADAVLSDSAGGARAAVAHLAAAGHRRIAFLGDREWLYTATERLRGYREGLAAAGLGADKRLAHLGLPTREAARDAALALLRSPEPPTALLAGTRLATLGALDAIRLTAADDARAAGEPAAEGLSAAPAAGSPASGERVPAAPVSAAPASAAPTSDALVSDPPASGALVSDPPAAGPRVAIVGFDDVALAGAIGFGVVAQDPRAMGRAAARLLFARLDGETRPARRLVVPTRLLTPAAPPSRARSGG